jgi:DNA-binding MarR family transcriptional regulator
LPVSFLRTLDAMSTEEWRTANEIRERAHLASETNPAMINRLRDMLEMGLVERSQEPAGRQWLWRRMAT